ncbi:MAG: hypothetical protein EZS28_041236, partial [Streblomastix strix]
MYRLDEEMRNKIESEDDQHNMTGKNMTNKKNIRGTIKGVDYTQQEQRQSGIHSKEPIIRSEEEQ